MKLFRWSFILQLNLVELIQERAAVSSYLRSGSIADASYRINSFRNRLGTLKPQHPWLSLDNKTFLYRLGAYGKDRKTGKEGITAAGLLMFGEERSIVDEFPKYFLDYREKLSDEVRWNYRIISSDGTWSGNLFDFYFKIIK